MLSNRPIGLLAAMLCAAMLFPAVCCAEDAAPSPDDEKEAAELKKVATDTESACVSGKLNLEPIEDGQPPPKFAGTLTTATEVFKIKLQFPDQRKTLVDFDKKEIGLIGYVLDKGEQGKILLFTSIDMPTGRAPGRKKRGGL